MVLNTMENFVDCTDYHFIGDKEVSPKDVSKAKKVININTKA